MMTRTAVSLVVSSAVVLCALATSSPAYSESAEDRKLTEEYWTAKGIRDRLNITFGFARTEIDARAQVNSTTVGVGTSINFEDAFGLDSKDSFPDAVGYYRFNRNSRIDFGFAAFDRTGTRVTEQDIQFGDEFIPAGTMVRAGADYEFIGAAYGYSIVNSGKIEAGISAGLTAIAFDFNVATSGLPTDIDAREDATLPLPVFGVYTNITLRPKVFFRYSAAIFALDYDRYSGTFIDARGGIDWFPFKHVGFGLGFIALNLNVEVDGSGSEFSGVVDLDFKGFDLSVSIIF